MNRDFINYTNDYILKRASRVRYIVKSDAPSSIESVLNNSSLVIWNGQSNDTIYEDKIVNYAFRAIHDQMHIDTGLNFNPEQEIELSRIQAAKIDSQMLADLFYIEISGQAEYYLKTGKFVSNQIEFMNQSLGGIYGCSAA